MLDAVRLTSDRAREILSREGEPKGDVLALRDAIHGRGSGRVGTRLGRLLGGACVLIALLASGDGIGTSNAAPSDQITNASELRTPRFNGYRPQSHRPDTLAYPTRSNLERDEFWSKVLGVPVYSFRTGEACTRDSLACVYALRPPIFVHQRILDIAARQLINRFKPPNPGPSERTAAVNGLNVILHEWAHAVWKIRNEANADCWAGQWLWDLEKKLDFHPSKRRWHQKYFWGAYQAAIDNGSEYGDEACYYEWNRAPGLFSTKPYERFDDGGNPIPPVPFEPEPAPEPEPEPEEPAPPPTDLRISDHYASNEHFGAKLWSAGAFKQRLYLNLRYSATSTAGHTVTVEWLRPDGTRACSDTWDIEAGYSGSSYWCEIGGDTLPPMAGRWVQRFSLDNGRQTGEWIVEIERLWPPVDISVSKIGSFVDLDWKLRQEAGANDRFVVRLVSPKGVETDSRTWTSMNYIQTSSWFAYASTYFYGSGPWTLHAYWNGSEFFSTVLEM